MQSRFRNALSDLVLLLELYTYSGLHECLRFEYVSSEYMILCCRFNVGPIRRDQTIVEAMAHIHHYSTFGSNPTESPNYR